MKKILCAVLALMLVLSLAACGGAGLGGNGGTTASNVGKYYFQSLEQEGMTIDRATLLSMGGMTDEQLDEYMCLEITAEGKAIMTSDGETQEMAYDATHMWPVDDPDEKANCTIANGKITIESEGTKMVFGKK